MIDAAFANIITAITIAVPIGFIFSFFVSAYLELGRQEREARIEYAMQDTGDDI